CRVCRLGHGRILCRCDTRIVRPVLGCLRAGRSAGGVRFPAAVLSATVVPDPEWTMRLLLAVMTVLALATPVGAQRQDTTRLPTGVRLDVFYNTMNRPLVAVRPFAGPPEAAAVAEQAHAIIVQDLDYSDRFVIAEVPEALRSGPVALSAWNDLGVVFLVTGEAEPLGDGYLVRLALHDVPFGTLKEIQAFRVPRPSDAGFRLAVHALS